MAGSTAPNRLAPEDLPLLAAVLLLPWAFGGVELWAYRSAALLVAVAASLALWRRGWAGWGLASGREISWLMPAFLLAVWALVQLLPMPPPLVRALSPQADRIYRQALPGYGGSGDPTTLSVLEEHALREVPEAAGLPLPEPPGPELAIHTPSCFDGTWRTLSLQPTATLERMLWYLALLLAFVVLRERVSDPRIYRVYRWALFGLFITLAVFGLVQSYTWNGLMYWVRPAVRDNVFGPYVNPTNFAWVMELGTPWMAGYALFRLSRQRRAALRQARFAMAMLGVGIGVVATVSAASKAGVALVASGLFCVAIVAASSWRRRAVVTLVWLVLAASAPLLLSQTKLGKRFVDYTTRISGVEVGEGRVTTTRAGFDMARDYALTGVGFGAFREVFPRYMPLGSPRWFDQAHNDYLELVTDGGLVAGGLVVWLVVGYSVRAWRRLRGTGRRVSLSRAGLAVGLVAASLHALIDFNHQIPANALLFVAACAMLLPVLDREAELGDEP